MQPPVNGRISLKTAVASFIYPLQDRLMLVQAEYFADKAVFPSEIW